MDSTEPISDAESRGLHDDIRGLREDTQDLTTSINEFATKGELNRETGRRRFSFLITGAVVMLLILGGLYVRSVADDAAHAITEITATRTESRRATCENDNHFIENHNKLVDANISAVQVFVAAATAARTTSPTPEQQARTDQFLADTTALFEASRVPVRKCDPASIEDFYKTEEDK